MSRQKLIAKLDKVFSEYVRRRDAINSYVRCCTCKTPNHWKNMHCGHYKSRKHLSTRWSEQNTGPQCVTCNIYGDGKEKEFSLYLDAKYGEGTAEQMDFLSKKLAKFTIEELKEKIEYYGKEIYNPKE